MDDRNILRIKDLFDLWKVKKIRNKLAILTDDPFTREALQVHFELFKAHALGIYEANRRFGLDVKLPNFPEAISENLIKFILHDHGDPTIRRKKTGQGRGDLISQKQGRIECKAFASTGPTSFGSKQEWDVLYVLDAQKFIDDRFVLYKIGLPKNSDAWKSVYVSQKRTFDDFGKERPRMRWSALYPQIKEHTSVVFDGIFRF